MKRKIKSVSVTYLSPAILFFSHKLVVALHVMLYIDMATTSAHSYGRRWSSLILNHSKKICFSHVKCVCQWRIQTLKDRKRLPTAYPNSDSWWGTGGKSSVSNKFSWLFESQLSLEKGGGKSPGSATVYICFLIYLFIFFSQQVILLFATSSKEKGSFFTIKLLGNYIMHPQDPPERIKLTSDNALSLCQDPWFPLLPLPIPYKRKMPHYPLGCQDTWSLVQAHPCVPTFPSHLSSAAQT